MNFDEMVETWRKQDSAPLGGVNRDLLQLVVRKEEVDMRRHMRMEQWITYGTSAAICAAIGAVLVLISRDDDPRSVSDYVAALAGAAAAIMAGGALWVSRRQQRLKERHFGDSLREQIMRNLSLMDYQLSRSGKVGAVILGAAPITVAVVLLYWLIIQINNMEFGIFDAGMVAVILSGIWSAVKQAQKLDAELRPQQSRLKHLLAVLDRADPKTDP